MTEFYPEHFALHRAEVDELYDTIASYHAQDPLEAEAAIANHSRYLARGSERFVFRSQHPGRLVKIPLRHWIQAWDRAIDPREIRDPLDDEVAPLEAAIAALDRARGAPRLEQIVGATTTRAIGLVVEEINAVPHHSIGDGLNVLATDHFHTLFDAYEALHERGLASDNGPGNVCFRPHDGFHLIDYTLRTGQSRTSPEAEALYFASDQMLTEIGYYNTVPYYIAVRQRYGQALAEQVEDIWNIQLAAIEEYHRIHPLWP
jgi:hypothetical protein